MFIDSTYVSESLRRTGVSQTLFEHTLAQVGKQNVTKVQSYFGPGKNLDIVREGIKSSLTPAEAAALTPRGRVAINSGFTKIEYDEFTQIFTATR